VGLVVKNLKKEIAVLRHANAKITSEMSGAPTSSIFNAEYVNTINQYILANAMKKNDFRELIMAYNSPVSPILNEYGFNKSLHVVSEFTNVDVKKIISRSRKSEVYNARRLLVVSILCFFKTTLVQLGKHLKKDHTTIIHYIDANKNWSYDNKKKTKSTL
jgi:chromosomal replication initiation ATPase DnaA